MLTMKQALGIATSAVAEAHKNGIAPISVAVLDRGAHVLALLRDEQASLGRPDIALAKASGCLAMGFGGRELARRAERMPQFYTTLATILPNGMVPLPGGVLIRDEAGEILGAVGVSGDTSENDERCAVAGISAQALVADTGEAQAR
jgi:uncharacterized protein GlcG (DUF336 family)